MFRIRTQEERQARQNKDVTQTVEGLLQEINDREDMGRSDFNKKKVRTLKHLKSALNQKKRKLARLTKSRSRGGRR